MHFYVSPYLKSFADCHLERLPSAIDGTIHLEDGHFNINDVLKSNKSNSFNHYDVTDAMILVMDTPYRSYTVEHYSVYGHLYLDKEQFHFMRWT